MRKLMPFFCILLAVVLTGCSSNSVLFEKKPDAESNAVATTTPQPTSTPNPESLAKKAIAGTWYVETVNGKSVEPFLSRDSLVFTFETWGSGKLTSTLQELSGRDLTWEYTGKTSSLSGEMYNYKYTEYYSNGATYKMQLEISTGKLYMTRNNSDFIFSKVGK